ncbi:MAG: hypothetical protein ACI9W2_002724, partial [Gammaproteobacteria bacterium]
MPGYQPANYRPLAGQAVLARVRFNGVRVMGTVPTTVVKLQEFKCPLPTRLGHNRF